TLASPLAGFASAEAFTGTISPTPSARNGVVEANRPTFSATFSAALASTSTIVLTHDGSAVSCPKTVSGNVVSCRPAADLAAGQSYIVAARGFLKSNSGVSTDPPAQSYRIEYPTFAAADST